MTDFGLLPAGIVAVCVLLGISAFFSSSEIAIFSLRPEWIASKTATGDADATTLAALAENSHRLLVTLLVGNNVVNVAISSITTVLAVTYLPPTQATVVATVVASSLVLIVGEILPKSYGLGHAETWSLRIARPLAAIQRFLYPLVLVFDLLTRGLSELLGGDPELERPYEGPEAAVGADPGSEETPAVTDRARGGR
ncbi:DUF21 domain-containing protein [Halosolutus halophilus]|uniref:DUF21 domain-containing protein n=1 Tax=Halosolutus halophilus TaxID=1552990 RepID=UPI0022352FC2|nr:DUF21 domain-containing protein [Halosolutus halophilus]